MAGGSKGGKKFASKPQTVAIWFSLAHKHKHNISISKSEHPRLEHKQKNEPTFLSYAAQAHLRISISTRKTNVFVCLVLMRMLVRK